MSDIVERLRAWADLADPEDLESLALEAANEIIRLREAAMLDRQEIERLRNERARVSTSDT